MSNKIAFRSTKQHCNWFRGGL